MKFMSTAAFLAVASLSIFSVCSQGNSPPSSGCGINGPPSCKNTTIVSNLCCFEHPGGLLVLTQFWDTDPRTGPENSFTIHGLWPDNCDTTFQENCDPSREYTNIAGLLTAQESSDTLVFMQDYWVDINGENEKAWEHAWATHGTCMSTLKPSCLPPNSKTGAEAVMYYKTVVKLFQTLPTYTWLANAGISPSSTETYSLSTLVSALQHQSGVIPALDCSSGVLNHMRWYFNLKGSVIDGVFIPINAPKDGSCPSDGIRYVPKA
ncbi:ribonuclease T2-like [Podila minutissima]|uniref:Ribonuclease T2-like n=1 Tax=Podila minutissima TaxID=64525 RepID=A0A9P5SQU2_9FUNG|nr:ribonuclease T2-like [Podila minutissima]